MTDGNAAGSRAARQPNPRGNKFPHAQAAKILTAGVSTSMVLGLVSYMADSANIAEAASAREAQRLEFGQIIAAKLFQPVATLPVTVPTTVPAPVQPGSAPPQLVTISVPVPVPVPAKPSTKRTTSPKPATTTRSSK